MTPASSPPLAMRSPPRARLAPLRFPSLLPLPRSLTVRRPPPSPPAAPAELPPLHPCHNAPPPPRNTPHRLIWFPRSTARRTAVLPQIRPPPPFLPPISPRPTSHQFFTVGASPRHTRPPPIVGRPPRRPSFPLHGDHLAQPQAHAAGLLRFLPDPADHMTFGSCFCEDIRIPAGTKIDFYQTSDGQLITEIDGKQIGAVQRNDLCREVCTPRQLVVMKDPSSIPTAIAMNGLTLPLGYKYATQLAPAR